jgi:uncharacterized membrane protein
MKKSRTFLWLVVVAISITGIALYLMAPANDDELPHPLNGLLRELHGVASALAIFIFGYFFSDHVKRKLAKHARHWTWKIIDGYCHLAIWVLLILSGLLLYYPQEIVTNIGVSIRAAHWYAGLALIGLFPMHFWRKKFLR